MAKFYNNRIKTGRVAGSVFAVRYGETIERAYQPIVNNPNTQAQIASRAKMKLMSQLAAVVAPVIAIPRMGSMSSRNLFIKENYGLSSFSNDEASVNLNQLQITKSVVALPPVSATRVENGVSVKLEGAIGTLNVDRVVYVVIVKQADNALRLAGTATATSAGTNNDWSTSIASIPALECVVLAYGVRDNTEAARVLFGNIEAVTAEQIAKIIVSRTLLSTDITLTETRGYTLPVSQSASALNVNAKKK